MIFKLMFSRHYWLFTLIVAAAIAICIRAGFWQMDRREQKRELNQRLAQRWDSPPFVLNDERLPVDLAELEFRRVEAKGAFDYEHQIILKNDFRSGVPGVNLVTPLMLEDGRAILVARGWVPLNKAIPEHWPEFYEPDDIRIVGLIKESQTLANAQPPAAPQTEWFRVDIDAIKAQMPYELLPAFIAMLPEPGRLETMLPIRTPPPAPYDEYMHVSYTIQWFTFAVIFGFGHIQYLIYQARRQKRAAVVHLQSAEHGEAATHLPTLPHKA